MKEKISQRLALLSEEAESLVKERSLLNDRFNQIEVRLAQIIGAMQEMDSILRSDQDATKENT